MMGVVGSGPLDQSLDFLCYDTRCTYWYWYKLCNRSDCFLELAVLSFSSRACGLVQVESCITHTTTYKIPGM